MPSPEPDAKDAHRAENEPAEDEKSKPKVAGPTVALLPQLLSPGSEWIHAQQQNRWRISVLVKGIPPTVDVLFLAPGSAFLGVNMCIECVKAPVATAKDPKTKA